jgi:hypothetical protein
LIDNGLTCSSNLKSADMNDSPKDKGASLACCVN